MNTTNLKSAVTCFHFLSQPLERDIDGNLSNTGRSNSDHGGILNLQKCQLEERDTRSILEFDAFAINITGFPVDQVHILQRYDTRKSRAVGKVDRILGEFKHHLVDLLLLSRFSPLPKGAKSSGLSISDFDWIYVDHGPFETREWCLLNLMIVVWNTDSDCAERLGLCVLHEDVWNQLDLKFKHIALK
ncbi:hypothetical protein BGZ57DRAFT_860359 [Hyaloscypha finlandica]|nr:hypothetical protein BGZ57DRAFT_860359 [Hyaloscypha finlandica]